jgi:hypothetical protein
MFHWDEREEELKGIISPKALEACAITHRNYRYSVFFREGHT